ncbi:centromere protein v [Cladorrhinum samala]|uniref:Centromere protein v n=1 Tax=Cladorrhinum samala TaxID=585594 RepID=A0AAV9HG93_9PEZI|nr:centromere protein v [Cladorrhinum samala]
MSADNTKSEETYDGGCHCGYIKFSATLSPPLSEQKVINCSCSICRRAGYLLVYPPYEKVKWHNDSRSRCATYQFNEKIKDQLFCPKCGISIGIDFRESNIPVSRNHHYGLSVRTFNNIDLSTLTYRQFDGIGDVAPHGQDLSGIQYEIDEAERLKGSSN